MKNILVPTDFSASSQKALAMAVGIAQKVGASLTVFHGYKFEIKSEWLYPTGTPIVDQSLEEQNSIRLHEFVAPFLHYQYPNGESLRLKKILKMGFEPDDIDQIVKKQNIDLVVMGTKGATGVEEMLLGSVTAYSVENLSCSVLAVPENASLPTEKILYMTNFEPEDLLMLDQLLQIAQTWETTVECLHVITSEKDWEQQHRTMRVLAQTYKHQPNISFQVLEAKDVFLAVKNYTNSKKIGILALYNKKRSFLSQIFHRSLSKRLVMEAQMPVLIFKYNP